MNIVALYFSKQVKIDIKATQKRLLVITTVKLALKSETTKYLGFFFLFFCFFNPKFRENRPRVSDQIRSDY